MYAHHLLILTSVDPLAEKYYSISPYAYCGNNPVNAFDPNGKEITFCKRVDEDGGTVIEMNVTGKLINESSTPYTKEEMASFSQRLGDAVKNSYGVCEEGFEVNVTTNITPVSADNPLDATDHAFRLEDPGNIPDPGNSGSCSPSNYVGLSPLGQNVVYLSTEVLAGQPATVGQNAGTGKTSTGDPTLERTGAHELLHSGNINGHPAPGTAPGNLQNQTSRPDAGTTVTKEQILKMMDSYEKGQLNKGQQEIK